MWAATRSAMTLLFERQLQYDSRSYLRNKCRMSTSRGRVVLAHRDPEPPDILLAENDLTESDLRPEISVEAKSRALATALECSEQALKRILDTYPEMARKPLNGLLCSANLLKLRYPVKNILEYPSALNLSWRVVDSRLRIFEEIKAKNLPGLPALIMFDDLLGLTLFELVRRKIVILKDLLPAIISKIEDCPPSLAEKLSEELTGPEIATFTLMEYRRFIIQAYLTHVLGEFKLRRSILKSLEMQSMDLISARVNILLKDLKLDPQFLTTQAQLLVVNVHNLQDIMSRCAILNGVPLREIASSNPMVLAMSAKKLCDMEKIIRSQHVSPAMTATLPGLYTIHPSLINPALADGVSSSEQRLSLRWTHYKDIALRMRKIAGTSNQRIQSESASETLPWRCPPNAVLDYLVCRLEANSAQRAAMRKRMCGHPLKRFSFMAACANTCDFLLAEGILTKAQIIRDVSICWWSPKTLRRGWELFPKDAYEEELGPQWKDHPLLAEMLLYEMVNLGLDMIPKLRLGDRPIFDETVEGEPENCVDEDSGGDDDQPKEGVKTSKKGLEDTA